MELVPSQISEAQMNHTWRGGLHNDTIREISVLAYNGQIMEARVFPQIRVGRIITKRPCMDDRECWCELDE